MSQIRARALPPYPRVVGCRHCGLVVLRDLDGNWIHASLSYVCRDRFGAVSGTTAEPTPLPPAPTTATRLFRPQSWSQAWAGGSDTV